MFRFEFVSDEVVDYQLVSAPDCASLRTRIVGLLLLGWRPLLQAFAGNGRVYQAMVLVSES
jgi:hypothetical protein